MHSGSRRAVMSLLQNFMLRNSIDRTLISGAGSGCGNGAVLAAFTRQPVTISRSVSTSMSLNNGPGSSKNSTSTENYAEPPLDKESLSKLNQLKDGLQTKNEYFEKYKEKLSKLESTSPRELLARLEQLDDQKKDHMQRLKNAEKVARKPRTLNDIMHMDSLKTLDRADIVHLWQEFHRHKEGLMAAVMSRTVYEKMSDIASVHKMFVMPLPRTDGYEFFFMQFEDNTFHFTPLILYQTHKDSAPVALRLINYTDLKKDKDLVLLRGEYDAKCLKAEDAHFLAVQTNFYYGETNESRLHILEKFTKKPDTFKHMELIDELKNIQSTHAQLFEFEPTNKSNSG